MAKNQIKLDEITIRFAGDSGDGMQLVGTELSVLCGRHGNGVNTFPDYPAEIRAPEGTLYGVSAYQVHIGSRPVYTFGSYIDVLVGLNASSVRVNLPNVREGGIIIVDTNGFNEKLLKLAEYDNNPLDDDTYKKYKVIKIDIKSIMQAELSDKALSAKSVDRTKNIFSLGAICWILGFDLAPIIK
jgi:2-oxoglutarate ferredoxin oxidoreductase subunit alpha